MGTETKIQWTDHTFNPWRGCTKVHEGCAHCYAERDAKRFPDRLGVWGPNGTRIVAAESMWKEPLKWNREAAKAGERRRVFCASLADVFEDRPNYPVFDSHGNFGLKQGNPEMWVFKEPVGPFGYPKNSVTLDDLRARLFALIDATPNLDWQLVTKRPANILRMWPREKCTCGWIQGVHHPDCESGNLLPRRNVWLLTSVSNQETADKMIPELLKCRDLVPVLGVSYEPALGPVDFTQIAVSDGDSWDEAASVSYWNALTGFRGHKAGGWESGKHLDWIIVGGESGHNARPFDIEWARSTIQQCQATGVACFVKQLGAHVTGLFDDNHGRVTGRIHLSDSKGGDMEEWSEDLRVRQFPTPTEARGT